jgi:hypothetical protein
VTIAAYRPAPPSASILAEVVCPSEDQRFRACEAICATVWAAGYNSCASSAERASWRARYTRYLATTAEAWTRENDPLVSRQGVASGTRISVRHR